MKVIWFLLLVRLVDGSPEQTIEVNTFGPMTQEQCKAERDNRTQNGYPMAPEVDGHKLLTAFWKCQFVSEKAVHEATDLLEAE
ncbi:hypothetical protein NKI51_17360 [Mesorhizobium australicum]|uniref:hypothetical protein n=1 Tax=Mesorhizobium australicum TaxID=536018 RepID=UPI003336BAB3